MARVKKTTYYTVDLKKIINKLGLSVMQVAKEAKINYEYLTKIVNGNSTMSEEMYNRINKVLSKHL